MAQGAPIILTPSFFLQRAWDFQPLLGRGMDPGPLKRRQRKRPNWLGQKATPEWGGPHPLVCFAPNPVEMGFPQNFIPSFQTGRNAAASKSSPVSRQAGSCFFCTPQTLPQFALVLGPGADIRREASPLWEERGCEGRGLLAPQIVSLPYTNYFL